MKADDPISVELINVTLKITSLVIRKAHTGQTELLPGIENAKGHVTGGFASGAPVPPVRSDGLNPIFAHKELFYP